MKASKEEKLMRYSEAMDSGYEYFGYGGEQWQRLNPLEDLRAIDFADKRNIFLFSKETYQPTISPEEVSDHLADQISDSYYVDSGNDSNDVYNEVKNIDFLDVSLRINEVLKKHSYRKLTNIRIVPG